MHAYHWDAAPVPVCCGLRRYWPYTAHRLHTHPVTVAALDIGPGASGPNALRALAMVPRLTLFICVLPVPRPSAWRLRRVHGCRAFVPHGSFPTIVGLIHTLRDAYCTFTTLPYVHATFPTARAFHFPGSVRRNILVAFTFTRFPVSGSSPF